VALTGGVSLLAAADGMTQPDPPVPLERPAQKVAYAAGDLDCRCAVLHARDMEGRIDGHVERFEALSSAPPLQRAAAGEAAPRLHLANVVEGVVGFPVRQFRLAADADSDGDVDDGAGSD
jgi:hypothetical protein